MQELCSKGYSQREISQVLQIGLATVNRDISYLRSQAKANIKKYINERLPEEYEKCLVGLTAITKEAWNTAHNTEDGRQKIQALSLAKECYYMKLELLTNATVVDDAIRFVSWKSKHKEKLNSSTNDSEYDKEGDKEGSNEPDYDEDQLEEEQEEETGEVTTNQVFDYLSKNTYLDLCHASIDGQFYTSDITAVIRSEE